MSSKKKEASPSSKPLYPTQPRTGPGYPVQPAQPPPYGVNGAPPPYSAQPQQYSAMGGPPTGAQQYYGPQYGTPVLYGAPVFVPLAGAQPYYGQPPQGVVLPGEFDAGARFDGTARPTIPPPPPGYMPNAAQIAAAQGHNVSVPQRPRNIFTGGSDGGYSIF